MYLFLSNETTFHPHGTVNIQNVLIWGSENPYVSVEPVRDSPKVKLCCAPSEGNMYGPFSAADTITNMVYLDTLELRLWPQQDFPGHLLFQQDGKSLHYYLDVSFRMSSCRSWIGRGGPTPLITNIHRPVTIRLLLLLGFCKY